MHRKNQGMRWAMGACLSIGLAVALAIASHAQTPDGETPAAEDICTLWGMTGKVNGLCNAYCEAMDCDAAEPQASEQACTRVLGKIEAALGDTPFPTCQDIDEDGVPNGLDNCPDDPNADQADANPTTPEGDACEPVVCPCFDATDLVEMNDTCSERTLALSCTRASGETKAQCPPTPPTPAEFSYKAHTWLGSEPLPPFCSIWDRTDNDPPLVLIQPITPEQAQACNSLIDAQFPSDQCQ